MQEQFPVACRREGHREPREFVQSQMPSILIIDDEEAVRFTLRHHFVARTWDVMEAESAESGIRLAEEFAPDIILLDMRLPDMDGIKALQKLKEHGSFSSVVFMTAWGTISNAVDAIKLGAEQYLTKPVEFVELDSLMDRILETRKLKIENFYYQQRVDHPIIGISKETQKLHRMIDLMAENADTIREIGQEMFVRLTTFAEHLAKLGRSLDSSVAAYNKAVASYDSRVLPGARKFTELGISTKKEPPKVEQVEHMARTVESREENDKAH